MLEKKMVSTMTTMADWTGCIGNCHAMKWFTFLTLRLSLQSFLCFQIHQMRWTRECSLHGCFLIGLDKQEILYFSYSAFKSPKTFLCVTRLIGLKGVGKGNAITMASMANWTGCHVMKQFTFLRSSNRSASDTVK